MDFVAVGQASWSKIYDFRDEILTDEHIVEFKIPMTKIPSS